MKGTMINVAFDTKDKLKAIKICSRETYDEIINRLISQQYDETFIKKQQ